MIHYFKLAAGRIEMPSAEVAHERKSHARHLSGQQYFTFIEEARAGHEDVESRWSQQIKLAARVAA